MQKLGAWFTSIAAVGFFVSLLQTLIPEKGKRTLQLASGLIIILLIFSPFRTSGKLSLAKLLEDFENQVSSKISEFSSRSAVAAETITIHEMEQFLCECLDAEGVSVSITLQTTESESGSCVFYSAMIYPQTVLTPAEQDMIQHLIEEQTGIPVERQYMR